MSTTAATLTAAITSPGAKLPRRSSPPVQRYRKDIDGLRAVAVLLVVVYHVWLDRVSGGVDAFLMISAFFLAGSFVRRLEAGKPLGIVDQWIRTFKRLLPAAAVVIAGTVVAAAFIMPASGLPDLWRHAWASLFYYENWALAAESVDYYADTSLASPLQHFWSLSVQGQIFLLWPLLFAVIAFARWALGRRSVRVIALVCFAVVFAVSLAYSVVTTREHQESAYFNTGARVWEFAAGSILAIALPWIRLPRALAAIIGWLGLAALLACGMVLDVQGGFPGYLALWPVLAVAAIILAGSSEDRGYGPAVLLETKLVLALGRDAYGLYLVHWPILVLTLIARRGEPLSFAEGLALILVSVVLARLLTWLVDAPVRRSAWANRGKARGLLVILVSIAVVAAPVGIMQYSADQQAAAVEASPKSSNPGAAVLMPDWDGEIDEHAPRIPLPTELDAQWGHLSQPCTDPNLPFPTTKMRKQCSETGVEDPELTVALVGNSHPEQWLEPLGDIAADHRWRVISPLMGGCEFTLLGAEPAEGPSPDTSASPSLGEECAQWNADLMRFISDLRPDVVISVGTVALPSDRQSAPDAGEREHLVRGQDLAVASLREQGIATVLIRDNPRFTFDSFVCVEQADDPSDCDVPRAHALAAVDPLETVAGPGVASVDMTDLICPADVCPAVIGNVNVYLDDNHLTISYTSTARPVFEERLLAAIADAMSWRGAEREPAPEPDGEALPPVSDAEAEDGAGAEPADEMHRSPAEKPVALLSEPAFRLP